MRWISMVAVVLAFGCSSDDVSKADARKLAEGLNTAKDAIPDDRVALIATACADVASCAKGCAEGLRAYAAAAPEARAAALAAGCADAKEYVRDAATPAGAKAAANFVVDRVSKFVARAAGALEGDERKKLNEARVVLKL